jgi:hypothetical protein
MDKLFLALMGFQNFSFGKKRLMLLIAFFAAVVSLYSQESLKSVEEEYYDFLALEGLIERPALNYRTLSDSVWNIGEGISHPWEGQNLGISRRLLGDFSMRIYGPELFMSYNTTAPYGQNDGALWQGRGFNTSFSGGVRFEGYGVEATFKPLLVFSQNAAFDIMKPEFSGANYADKAAVYGYFWGTIDAPQRFGDQPLFAFDWGDTEIRYAWHTLTIGFGTQPIWLGPAYLNPILHSNNAPSYPKVDIGLRRQPVTIPGINWYAGDVELRIWTGYLSESDYFDNNDENDHTMFHGLAFAYAPSFAPGLVLSLNRASLLPFAWENLVYIIPMPINTAGDDQKASLAFSYAIPHTGFEIFGELGIDDYVWGGLLGYIRHPFHTTVYTIGFKKALALSPEKKIYGKLIFESNWMEMTQTFYYKGRVLNYSYYFHSGHGYTNRGQILGNSSSPGGNSQYFAFKLYYPKGVSELVAARNNPDTNYIIAHGGHDNNYWANFILGLNTSYAILPYLRLNGGITYNMIINEHFIRNSDGLLIKNNFSFSLGFKFDL